MPGIEEAGQEAREQAARAEDDQLGIGNRLERVVGRQDVVRAEPDALDAGGAHDRRLALDLLPVLQPRVQCQRRGRNRHDLTAHGENPVDPSDTLLEIAVLERRHGRDQQVAHGVPGEPLTVPARSLVREPVLEHAVHHRLGVGERRDAVADVADGRDPELAAEHAGRAAVVSNRDDRREVARVLLHPAQQRRQPGPSTDRHDPGPAVQEALLVDDLDQRLESIVRAERVHECPDDHHRADRHAGEADARDHEDPGRSRQEAQGQEVDQRFADPARLQLARQPGGGHTRTPAPGTGDPRRRAASSA